MCMASLCNSHLAVAAVAHVPTGGKLQKKSLASLESRSIFTPSSGGPPSSWMAIKLIYPYQIAAFIPPLITAAIMPMCMSSQVGQVNTKLVA